ncbi:MAG TPA: SIS domain-containing protein [Phycisphaerae bacterium]|jgi:D-sedoheptulose 7-phosphate isomerase|nr:SIS domain-containing protein [Phycisphaerae bacterium]
MAKKARKRAGISKESIGDYIAEAASTVFELEHCVDEIAEIARLFVQALKRGNKVLTCGNGGSAAEAMHMAEELSGKYSKPRQALPGLCLCADGTALTCIANDWDFAAIFSRQVEAFARKGDLLVMFTTSGNSENCLRAAAAMKKAGGKVIGLLGKGGGKAKGACDVALVVPSDVTNHIQEAHQVVLHLVLEAVDAAW